MASINYGAKEISVKIVYYGPGLCGKTTNLQIIHQKIPRENKSNMVSLATETDRTLFFDFLPLDLGKIKGFTTKFQLYTVPGQVYYNATRKLVLRGVDGVVFVVDSQPSKVDENLESFQNLLDNLAEYGYQIQNIPVVMQFNKRDLPDALPVDQLQTLVNKSNFPWTEAVAIKGKGVFDTLKLIGKIVIDELNRKYSRTPAGTVPGRPAAFAAPAPRPAPAPVAPRPPVAPPPPPPRYTPPPQQPVLRPVAPQPPRAPAPQQQFAPQRPQQPAYSAPQQMPARPPAARPAPAARPEEIDPFLDAPGAPQPRQQAFPAAPVAATLDPLPPPLPAAPQPVRSPAAPAQFDYNMVNLAPMGESEQPARIGADDTATAFPEAGMPVNKSELDLEIERYQREIEERQQHPGAPAPVAPRPAAQPAFQQPAQQEYAAQDIEIYQPPAQQQPAAEPYAAGPSFESTVQSQDYDVYDVSAQQAPAADDEAQPDAAGGEQENADDTDSGPMYFTSVNTDRSRKKVKRPVNPKERAANKGLLSKFFNKKEQDE